MIWGQRYEIIVEREELDPKVCRKEARQHTYNFFCLCTNHDQQNTSETVHNGELNRRQYAEVGTYKYAQGGSTAERKK